MFSSRNKKNNVYPCKPQFYYINWGLRGSKLYRNVFVMHRRTKKDELQQRNRLETVGRKTTGEFNRFYSLKGHQPWSDCSNVSAAIDLCWSRVPLSLCLYAFDRFYFEKLTCPSDRSFWSLKSLWARWTINSWHSVRSWWSLITGWPFESLVSSSPTISMATWLSGHSRRTWK